MPVCLVPRELRFGVPERVSAEGKILRSPTDEELAALADAMCARAAQRRWPSRCCFSFANPETERRVEAALLRLGVPVSASHRILPEFREYERASTTVVNAYLAPRMQSYLAHLEQRIAERHPGGRVDVMQSSGGIVPARLAAREPVRTVLSGPAGGVIGACQVARWAGFDRIIGFDMGGTSTDVFLADAAAGGARADPRIGGGRRADRRAHARHSYRRSRGRLDRALRCRRDVARGSRVGGRGSWAHLLRPRHQAHGHRRQLVLGRLDAESFLGGGVRLDRQRTERIMREQKGPLATVEEFAAGILRVVETQMEKAIRVISVERGHDPRDFTLVAFGGGGPLHACSLARALRIPRVLVPALPGALSAVGILLADAVRDYSRTVMLPGDAIVEPRRVFCGSGAARRGGVCRRGTGRRGAAHPRSALSPPGIRAEC